MRTALCVAAATSFVVYAAAIQWFFARPDGVRPRMRALSILGIIGAASHVISLVVLELNSAPLTLGALALYGSALALFAWAWQTTRRAPLSLAFSSTHAAGVVTGGPYRLLQHPFYTSYSITWLAGCLAVTNVVVVALSVAIIAIYVHAAREEERQLRSGDLGDAYRRYARPAATESRCGVPRLR